MHVLYKVLFFALFLLIKLGDAVLFMISLVINSIVHVFSGLFYGATHLDDTVERGATSLIRRLTRKPKHPREVVLLRGKKRKKNSSASLSFFTKFRYFLLGSFFSLLIVGIPLSMYVFLQSLPNPNQLITEQIPQTTKIYDRNHTLLYQIYASQNRTLVPLKNIPKFLQEGTIAIEDKDFYKHPGFNIEAIIRSFIVDVKGKNLQGGSTITQQLIKSSLLTPETSIIRKVKEVVLAFWAERMYSKNQILQLYFNTVPYGGTSWGVEAASETYFGKHVEDLDLSQSAFLAGLPQAPSEYSPYSDTPNLWKGRQKDVLQKMKDQGYITPQQQQDAEKEELTFQTNETPISAPHFVFYVRDLLIKKYGLPLVEKGGLTVTTSLDLSLQNRIQKIVQTEVTNDSYLTLSNGAALVTNPKTGEVLAMVGSHEYNDPNNGNVNLTTSLRQPGSSIKVVTYATALQEHLLTAASIIDDTPITYPSTDGGPSYSPVNYDGKFHGRVPLRIALANSFNIPAVKTLNQEGIDAMVSMAKNMGVTTWGDPSQYGLSLTLGAAEVHMTDMAEVYGTLANQGQHVPLNPIETITDGRGNLLEEHKTPVIKQVIDRGVAYIISSILADNSARSLEFGPASPLVIPGKTVSVKTGTTDDKRDNWTFGYTPDYLVAVWVGNNDNTPMSQALASGITGAAPIWHSIMSSLLTNHQDQKPTEPDDIIVRQCFGHPEYFLKGTENSVGCVGYSYPSQNSPTPTPH